MLNGDLLIVWFLASLRATGLMLIAPVFSSRALPAPLRVMIALFAAFLAALIQKMPSSVPTTLGALVVAGMIEIMIGLFMGWAVRLVLNAVEVASQVISSELGFTMGQQIDPMSDTSESAIGQLLMSFGSLLFLISGAHQAVLAAFFHSYEIAPMGAIRGNEGSGMLLVDATGKIFQSGLQMAAPLVAVNFIISLTFSILGKAAPATHVFGESFAVRIVVGLTLLGITLTLAAQLLLAALHEAPEMMLRVIP
jgi:flagellar biosynthesis protein FliR